MEKIFVYLGTFLNFVLLFSCQVNESSEQIENSNFSEIANYPKQEVPIHTNKKEPIKLKFIPDYDTVPFSFKIHSDNVRDFYKERSENYTKKYRYDHMSSAGDYITITIINSESHILLNELAKNQYGARLPFKESDCIIKENIAFDSITKNQYFLIDSLSMMKYFNSKDSIYLIESLRWANNYDQKIYFTFHILFNESKKEFSIISINKEGEKLGYHKLFSASQDDTEYRIEIFYKSLIKVFSKQESNQKKLNYKLIEDYEIDRYYISEEGKIWKWNKFSREIRRFCQSLNSKRNLESLSRVQDTLNLVPISLDLEREILDFLNKNDRTNSHYWDSSYNSNYKGIYFYQLIKESPKNILFTLYFDSGFYEEIYLLSFSKLHGIDNIYRITTNQTLSRKSKQINENLIVTEIHRSDKIYHDSIFILEDEGIKIIKEAIREDVKIDSLDNHFPFKETKYFNVSEDNFSQFCWSNKSEFPKDKKESLNSYLRNFNSTYFGYNYSLNKSINGNSYLITTIPGSYGCSIYLYVYNSKKIINPHHLELSSSWGDGGDYYLSYGRFINDSIYVKTSLSGDEYSSDSTTVEFLINFKGRISEIKKNYYQSK